MVSRTDLSWLLILGVGAALISLRFIDWPLNRDITTYATIAAELDHGAQLYVDVWDIKPPGVFATYLAARWAIPDPATQVFLLRLIPTLIILAALFLAAGAGGFGRIAAVTAGGFWVLLSGNIALQMHEPNTEVFINACSSVAFLLLLGLAPVHGIPRALAIGLLFALACLFKTVAIAIAAAVGIAYLVLPQSNDPVTQRTRQFLAMTSCGATVLASVLAYFAATGRIDEFGEVIIDAGSEYAGDLWSNVWQALTLHPIAADKRPLVRVALALAPWLALACIAGWWDRPRSRSWLLLGAYAFGALVAVGLPGSFYRHYSQLLVPPFCLAIGWLAETALPSRSVPLRRAPLLVAALAWLGLALLESRAYRTSVDEALAGTYQDLYLQTQRMARRLAQALRPDETLYQWGEESGLYWYSGRRPPASILTYPMLVGPQADRLTRQSLSSLVARPPDLIVAVNYMLDDGKGHPVFEWMIKHYVPAQPRIEAEQKYFTFFVPRGSGPEFFGRVGAVAP